MYLSYLSVSYINEVSNVKVLSNMCKKESVRSFVKLKKKKNKKEEEKNSCVSDRIYAKTAIKDFILTPFIRNGESEMRQTHCGKRLYSKYRSISRVSRRGKIVVRRITCATKC